MTTIVSEILIHKPVVVVFDYATTRLQQALEST